MELELIVNIEIKIEMKTNIVDTKIKKETDMYIKIMTIIRSNKNRIKNENYNEHDWTKVWHNDFTSFTCIMTSPS